jgi:hypothetical protein
MDFKMDQPVYKKVELGAEEEGFDGSSLSVTLLLHSVCAKTGKSITTWMLDYPRLIHAEVMTHRMFSRNAGSSRAMPSSSVQTLVEQKDVVPCEWRKNISGMQAGEDLNFFQTALAKFGWDFGKKASRISTWLMSAAKLHKQWANRPVEPFSNIRIVMTTTELENFFWLRDHKDAQPEIQILAKLMYQAMQESEPQILRVGQWHLPFIDSLIVDGQQRYYREYTGKYAPPLFLDEAKRISASCAAQTSYRKLDKSLTKADNIFESLIYSEPMHSSPIEHQATPIGLPPANIVRPIQYFLGLDGVTAFHKDLGPMSGNFAGWIQYRQTLKDNTKW